MAADAPPETDATRVALDLFEIGVRVMRQNLYREHAHATDDEIDARLRAWLHDRPGAINGDCSGRPIVIADSSA